MSRTNRDGFLNAGWKLVKEREKMLGRIFRKEDNKDIRRIQVSFILGIAEATKTVSIFSGAKNRRRESKIGPLKLFENQCVLFQVSRIAE